MELSFFFNLLYFVQFSRPGVIYIHKLCSWTQTECEEVLQRRWDNGPSVRRENCNVVHIFLLLRPLVSVSCASEAVVRPTRTDSRGFPPVPLPVPSRHQPSLPPTMVSGSKRKLDCSTPHHRHSDKKKGVPAPILPPVRQGP